MRRRGLTVLLGALLTLLLGWQIGRADVPYVALSPGPTVDTLSAVDRDGEHCDDPVIVPPPVTPAPGSASPSGAPPSAAPSPAASPEPACQDVIQVTGTEVSRSRGQLRMVTVSVHSGMNLLEAIKGWISGEDAVVPRKLIYPEDQTEQQVEERNRQEFEESQTSAETAALKQLGYPVRVTVTEVNAGGASSGKLNQGDVIESVDGTPVTSMQKLLELVRAKPAGSTLRIGYARGETKATVDVVSKAADDGAPRIGVGIRGVQPHPFQLRIKLDKIGGPSAGMMFALGIVDKLTPGAMTGGEVVAGTGTIDAAGAVGAIGGIRQKLWGAEDAGADWFLAPASNCDEVTGHVPDGIDVFAVATLEEARTIVETIGEGGDTSRFASCPVS